MTTFDSSSAEPGRAAPTEQLRYAEDLEVGEIIELADSGVITEADIIAFAQDFDPLPFHVDKQAARRSPMGGLIASGIHTLALFGRISVPVFQSRVAVVAGRGMDDVRLVKPVRPGVSLSGRMTIVDIAFRGRRADVSLDVEVRDSQGDPVLVLRSYLVVLRRP